MKNLRLFRGINDEAKDVPSISPDSFRFHGTMKALFYKVLRLINPPPKRWTDELDGNMGVLNELVNEYLGNEKQEWRRDVLSRVLPFSLLLATHDENYEEVANWFLARIIQEADKGRFKFKKEHMDPNCWFQDGRGRVALTREVQGMLEDYYAEKSKVNQG